MSYQKLKVKVSEAGVDEFCWKLKQRFGASLQNGIGESLVQVPEEEMLNCN